VTETPARTGTLYCVPSPIADLASPADHLPPATLERLRAVDYVVAERARTARAFLKAAGVPRPIAAIEIVELNEHTPASAIAPMLEPLRAGRDAALVSEAGCPAVADPGSRLVLAAHEAGIAVQPMVGPSALLLALMGSGLNGQRFAFEGYLPVAADARRQRLLELERRSAREGETVLFIETPYRNRAVFDALLATLHERTLLCVAAGLTGAGQRLATATVARWRLRATALDRQPTVFLFLAR
jgi:16S rRNA (cytidine1402-2'-O)-methyltransferase